MPVTPPTINLAKHVPPPSAEQIATLKKLSELRFETFNESDVREEFLVPLIGLLGYQRNSDYSVLREESYSLTLPHIHIHQEFII